MLQIGLIKVLGILSNFCSLHFYFSSAKYDDSIHSCCVGMWIYVCMRELNRVEPADGHPTYVSCCFYYYCGPDSVDYQVAHTKFQKDEITFPILLSAPGTRFYFKWILGSLNTISLNPSCNRT